MNEVKVDESLVPAGLEEEAIEVEDLLAEPKSDHVSVDGVFCLENEENVEKCLKMENNSSSFEGGGLKTNSGGMDSNTTQEEYEHLRFGVFVGMLPEVDEVGNVHVANGLSTACEDYLLDAECAEKVPESNFAPFGGSSLDNSSSESHSPDFARTDDGAVGISESSVVPVLVPKNKNDTLDKATICRLHGAFRSKCGCQTQVEDNLDFHSPNSFDSEDHVNMENENDLTSNHDRIFRGSSFTTTNVHYENGPGGKGVKRKSFAERSLSAKNSVEAGQVGNLVTQKRLRKPTKRYIEEVSELSSKNSKGKQKSSTSPKVKHPRVKCQTEHHHMEFRGLKLDSEKGPLRTTSEYQESEGFSKEHASPSGFDSEEEPYSDDSEDDSGTTVKYQKGDDRRKHQRMWTLSEVIKLVDGISHYGVGRWTDIKRLLFSCSDYRTPIDLRDKWRNLLRASHSWLQSEREDEQKHNQPSRPLPKSVLHRVSELASIYPYPRARSSKHSQGGDATSPALLTNKGTPFGVGRRSLR